MNPDLAADFVHAAHPFHNFLRGQKRAFRQSQSEAAHGFSRLITVSGQRKFWLNNQRLLVFTKQSRAVRPYETAHFDVARRAEDAAAMRRLGAIRARKQCQRAAFVTQNHRGLLIDAGRAYCSQRRDFLRRDAQSQCGESERINADIEQAASALLPIEVATFGIPFGEKPEIGDDLTHFADLLLPQPGRNLSRRWQKARPQRFHAKQVFAARQIENRFGLGSVDGEGFFHQNRFSGAQTLQRMRCVIGRRRTDVNHIHFGVLGQSRDLVITVRRAEFATETFRALLRARSDRDEFRLWKRRQSFGELPGVASANDAPANFWFIHRFFHLMRPACKFRHARSKTRFRGPTKRRFEASSGCERGNFRRLSCEL